MKGVNEPAKGKQEGFKRVSGGWHVFEFLEGIAKLQNKEGELSTNKDGDQLWKFPTKVNDESDTDNDIGYDIILPENDSDYKWLARYLKAANAKKFAEFEKAFPGDRSFFEEDIIKKIMASKNQLTGEMVKLKIEVRDNKKDANNPFYNVVAWLPMSATQAEMDELDGAKKGGAAAAKVNKEKDVVVDDEPF